MSSKRLDNLIPLRGRLNEWQLAGWAPSAAAEQGLGCRLTADVMIPMADGTMLSADVYTPKAPGRYPVIVQFSAYNRDLHSIGVPTGTNEIGSPPVITDRGYAQVVVTARGIGRSGGKLLPWLSKIETADYLRCIAWAAEQPWSSGDVCLFGTSYYGMIQPLAAVERPPALRAFFCNEICTDFHRQVFQYGGLFNVHFFSLWCGANFTTGAMRRHVPPVVRAALSHIVNRPWLWHRVRHHVDRLFAKFKTAKIDPEALKFYAAAVANREDELDPPLGEGPYRDLAKIEVPFVVVQNRGLVGLHQFGAYDLFEHAGTPSNRKWLIVGPAEYQLPVYSWQLEALAFFDHVVKGVDNGYDRQAPVRYWEDGTGTWRTADDFPPADGETLRLYPTRETGGALATSAPAEHPVRWVSVPRGVPVLPGLGAVRPEVLRFSWTAPRPMALAGPVTMRMRYACNEIDSYVIARLDRIGRSGARRCLAMGHLRPACRRQMPEWSGRNEIAIDVKAREPLTPGEAVALEFSLTPAAASLAEGDTLELAIASRSDLLWLTVADGFVLPDPPMPPYYAENTLTLGGGTVLEVTVRGG